MFHFDPKTLKNIEKKGKEALDKSKVAMEPVADFSKVSFEIGKGAFSEEWVHLKELLGHALSDAKKIPNIKSFDDAKSLAGEAGGQIVDFAKASVGVAQKSAKEYQIWYEGRQGDEPKEASSPQPENKIKVKIPKAKKIMKKTDDSEHSQD